ncbi:MAG: glycosyltransferase [Candidatus Krumholzibacteriia bacterium]
MKRSLTYTVLMLVETREDDFAAYLLHLHEQLSHRGLDHELVVAVSGPGAFVRAQFEDWPERGPRVRVYELTRNLPIGACLQAVLEECHGELLIVCGPYQQIADDGLDALLAAVASGDADLAMPWRQGRVDPLINQWQSRLFNHLVRGITGADFHDLSGTLRVLRRNVLEEIVLYGDLYRYLPLLAKKRGFRVKEIAAPHTRERGQVGYYGIRSYITRFTDLLTLGFNFGFSRQPLRYFGPRGTAFMFVGFLGFAAALALKLAGLHSLGNSPLLLVGLVLVVAGSGLWGVGLLGEILAFTLARKRKEYVVETILE